MKQETVDKLLVQTKATYNAIVADFNQTRSYLWPGLQDFARFVKNGDKVLDLGCGNGKLRLLFKDVKIDYTGVDNANELLKIGQERDEFSLVNQKFVQADVWQLPFADNTFDAVFFMAVLHHLPGKDLRLKALQEVKRVLKPNGILVMTNWNRYKKESLSSIIDYTFKKLIGKSELDFKDIMLPWQNGKAYRYYHAFTLGELKKLIKQSGLNLQDNYLAEWSGKRAKKYGYLQAANLVTLAKK